MSPIRRSQVSSLWIAVAVLGGAAIAGCGSAGDLGGTDTSATSGIQFTQCMRANDVPNVRETGANGNIQFVGPIAQPPIGQGA